MEEGKKVVGSPPPMPTFLSEIRIESSSPSAIGFSDSCPCCGNKKRHSLLPASSYRKKFLALTSIPNPISPIASNPISPFLSPPPPTTKPEETLERSNSTLTEEKGVICTAKEENKVRLKKAEDDISPEEVRVCFRCRCGVVRRIRLVQ